LMRAGANFQELSDALSGYSSFYDVKRPDVRIELSDLKILWEKYSSGVNQTDIFCM
jgi:hypothetical protein